MSRVWPLVLMLFACTPQVDEEPWQGGLREILGESETHAFRRAETLRDFSFPQDHGGHPDYRSEWWYITCVLAGEQERQFGLQFTLFRQALGEAQPDRGNWKLDQVYLAHLALSDVGNQRHLHDRRFARQHPDNARVEASPFSALIEDWQLTESGSDPWQLQLSAAGDDHGRSFAVQLELVQVSEVVLQGEQGLSHKGPGQASYYYSIPRLQTAGVINLGGEAESRVVGNCWLDREWSSSVLATGVEGWNWLSLSLADVDLMAFTLLRTDGTRDSYDHGLLHWAGETKLLSVEHYTMSPLRFWRDDRGHLWPVAWRVDVEGLPSMVVEAVLDDQLMDMDITYWEGLVSAYDASSGELLGRGYLELTGYNGTLSARGGGRLQ